MTRTRLVLAALLPLALHALAREADRALGLVLQAEVVPPSLAGELLRAAAADGSRAVLRLSAWIGLGAAAWLALALWRSRASGLALPAALQEEITTLRVLWLRPALTLVAFVSVLLRPSFPYAFTLPVALTQDWSLGQDALALAAVVALRAPAVRWPVPRWGEVFLLAFLGYAVMVPHWAWRWEGHPGNEPKYLRQAVALALYGSFDAEDVSAGMEELPPRPLGPVLATAAATVVGESGRMLVAVATGAAGRDAIRATRVTRQTVRGKDGGVYYVLAPGPSLMLAPTLRLDRSLNLARGTPGRVPFSVLLWCALAALLVTALFLLLRDAVGRGGLAAALAFGFALLPPFLFYPYQFYPEMVGALLLAVAFRLVALRPELLVRRAGWCGWMLATLPWLHQKFLPVWGIVALTAAYAVARATAARERGGRFAWRGALRAARKPLVALLLPQAASLYLTALYNFAITGSVRPDALFLAWGPGGVTSERVGQGVLGILFDARFGILPWVPVLLLAAAGLRHRGARRFTIVLPSVAVYYLTVASADNWSGAVCNLGRYFMPVAPLAVALVALALDRETTLEKPEAARRGALAIALVLAAWSALFALALWQDPQAANDSALLIAKSTYADGNQYIPNLFFRRWSEAAPGLWARLAAWLIAAALVVAGARRARSPLRALAGIAIAALLLGLALERWPSRRTALADPGVLPVSPATRVRFAGAVRVREDEAILGPGHVELVVRTLHAPGSAAPAPLRATVGGEGLLRFEGLPPVRLRPTGGVVDLPLLAYHVVSGADGRDATFSRLNATVSGQAVMRFSSGEEGAAARPVSSEPAGGQADQTAEPGEPGSR